MNVYTTYNKPVNVMVNMILKRMKMILFLFLLVFWLAFIFNNSSQGYHQQSLLPFMEQNLSRADIADVVPDVSFRYDRVQVNSQMEPFKVLEFYIRKIAHLLQYAVLASILVLVFLQFHIRKVHTIWASLLIVMVSAALDEYNQSLNPDRTGSIWDFGLDMFGGLLGVASCLVIHMIWQKYAGYRERKGSLE